MPSVSAKTSEVTLSVSISKRGSPEATVSPFLRFQVPSVPEVMDSPTEGMRMGIKEVAVLMVVFFQSWFLKFLGEGAKSFSVRVWVSELRRGRRRLREQVGLVREGGSRGSRSRERRMRRVLRSGLCVL